MTAAAFDRSKDMMYAILKRIAPDLACRWYGCDDEPMNQYQSRCMCCGRWN